MRTAAPRATQRTSLDRPERHRLRVDSNRGLAPRSRALFHCRTAVPPIHHPPCNSTSRPPPSYFPASISHGILESPFGTSCLPVERGRGNDNPRGGNGCCFLFELRCTYLVHLDGRVVLGVLERVWGQDSGSARERRAYDRNGFKRSGHLLRQLATGDWCAPYQDE